MLKLTIKIEHLRFHLINHIVFNFCCLLYPSESPAGMRFECAPKRLATEQ